MYIEKSSVWQKVMCIKPTDTRLEISKQLKIAEKYAFRLNIDRAHVYLWLGVYIFIVKKRERLVWLTKDIKNEDFVFTWLLVSNESVYVFKIS